jgi:hypothetical protein
MTKTKSGKAALCNANKDHRNRGDPVKNRIKG